MAKNNESTMQWKVDIAQLKSAMQDAKRSISLANAEFKTATAGMDKWANSTTGLEAKLKQLNSTLPHQKTILAQLEKQYKITASEMGEGSSQAQKLKIQIENQKGAIAKTEAEIDKYKGQLKEVGTVSDQTEDDVKELNDGFTVLKGTMANLAAQAITGVINGLKKMGDALIQTGKQAIMSYADYEQLVGGVETLFGAGGMTIEEYAKSVGKTTDQVKEKYNGMMKAQETVLANAANAYKTAGLSQNAYMETVTSFSASLISSLGGDTAKAAKVADQAITDMSDNANKMGTSMTDIQNAYQGFAKQNYTMLDNLKLGYGGTKEEMNRLIADANKLKVAQGEAADLTIDSYADVIEAIHLVQTEMGITGTTAKEAATTITGSLNMTKAAWSNVLTAMADDSADFDSVLDSFIDSALTFGNNVIPRVKTTIEGMGKMISGLMKKLLPQILKELPSLVQSMIPVLNEAFQEFLVAFVGIVPEIIRVFSDLMPEIVASIAGNLPQMLYSGMQIIQALINGVTRSFPQIIGTIASLIPQMVSTLINNLPELIVSGMQMLVAVGEGILQAIPDFLTNIDEVISEVLNDFLMMLPELLTLGAQMLTSLLQGLMEMLPTLIEWIPTILQSITEVVMTNLPLILDAGVQILLSLLNGLIEALPQLVNYLPTIINSIVQFITQNLPQIIQMGIKVLLSLIQGLVNALPKLIAYLPQIITTIVQVLTNNLPLIIKAGIQILLMLIQGLTEALPDLIKMLPEIIFTIVDTLTENLPDILAMGGEILWELIKGIGGVLGELGKMALEIGETVLEEVGKLPEKMLEIGGNIVSGIWNGISNGYEWIKGKISGWVGDVVGWFKKKLGIGSPSKVFRDQIGDWLPQGIAAGFDEQMPKSLNSMKNSLNGAIDQLKSDVSFSTSGLLGDVNVTGSTAGGSSSQNVTFNQTINSPKAVDRLTIYRETNSLLFSAKVRLSNV